MEKTMCVLRRQADLSVACHRGRSIVRKVFSFANLDTDSISCGQSVVYEVPNAHYIPTNAQCA